MGKEKKVSWEDIAEHTTEEKKASTAIGPEHCHRPRALPSADGIARTDRLIS